MKNIFILFCFIIVPEILPQNLQGLVPCREIFLRVKNAGSTPVSFRATTTQSTRWDNVGILTNGFQELQITLNGNTPISEYCKYGFSFNNDCNDPPYSIELGRNLYIISVDGKSASFSYNANGCIFQNDIYITYDYFNDIFYHGGGCDALGNTPITSYIGYSGTSCLELYLTISSQNNHPYLTWNPYHTSVTGYYVHKKLTTESGTMTTQHDTTSTNWTDNDFTIGNPRFTDDEVEYWITAKLSPTQQSLEGNHIVKYGTSWIQWKISNQDVEDELNFNLKQNYPNPFNPNTIINYQIPSKSFVTLKVYDVLGNEVVMPVNEWKEPGSYNAQFTTSGKQLASGMYFYTLTAGKFTDTKKFILMK